ncbi:MAG: phage integrase N-terminal SAM-like domain-containing protein [Verrucomicrobia bacterium]|nr:phage integrase N-terminal SAM-like domain-containing protein [Verrucomicrobiota bacterium]
MQLYDFSPKTQENYVAAVRQLAGHFHLSPDTLNEEHLRQYLLYPDLSADRQANVKKVARSIQ